MDCSLPGSSVHGILQARILEWVAISFSRESSWSGDQTYVSCIAGRLFTNLARREALIILVGKLLRCESAVGKEKDSRCPPRRYWGFSEVDTCHRMSVRWTHDVYLLCHWHWSPCACLRTACYAWGASYRWKIDVSCVTQTLSTLSIIPIIALVVQQIEQLFLWFDGKNVCHWDLDGSLQRTFLSFLRFFFFLMWTIFQFYWIHYTTASVLYFRFF